jgi:hypothetical protein
MGYYNSNFSVASALALAGDAHIMRIGDSTSYENREWTPAHLTDLLVVYPHIRWHYMVGGASTGKDGNYVRNDGYGNVGGAFPATTYGDQRAHYDWGTWGPKLIRTGKRHIASGDLTDTTEMATTTQGIQLNRMFAGVVNNHDNEGFPWPKTNGIGRPWFHDSGSGDGYVKAKLIIATHTADQIGSIDFACKRIGASGSPTDVSAFTTWDLSGALDSAYAASAWTAVVADDGDYQTTAGSQLNDHAVQLLLRTSTGYTETANMSLALTGAIFARCNSGGTIATNARGASAGYDAFGRSGSYVTDWADNYADADEWGQYFLATVLNPLGITVMFIELGRNVSEASGGAVTATWSTKYQTFIDKLKAAYAAAFPTGTLHLVLIVPPLCIEGGFMANTTAGNSLQAAVEALAGANGCSWFSFYEYFGRTAPTYGIHSHDLAEGLMFSRALRDAMDRATGFAYANQGIVLGEGLRNRNWR